MKYPEKEIFMADNRKKASMSQVLTDIKPYIINMIAMMTKRFVENVLKKGQKNWTAVY